jgi:hypothetical protein
MLSITIKMTVSIMATSFTTKIFMLSVTTHIITVHSMTLKNTILSITKTAIFSIITVINAILSTTTPYNYAESNLFTISQKGRLS